MSDKLRVRELLEQMLDSDRSADDVCAGDPALLHDVRVAWEQYQFVADQIEAIFPTHNPAAIRDSASCESPDKLPQVDGYHIDCVLGYGGMGVVYRARHLKLNRLVALKMLLAGNHAGPQDRSRFTRESQAVAALRHPNIAQVYDAGEADGRPYFTMELVGDGSLSQKLGGTPQPAREAAQLVSILARGVQSAHECGIVHRDLKPGNVLLAADGTPKITDFGLARRLENDGGLTRTGDAVGTPSYMAPEQARGKAAEVGPAADIYALGAILYECLTGRPPFKGETGAETVLQVIHQDPVAPSRLNHRVPRDLETICLKCLHKQPARRYASAAALADDLGRFAEGQPIQARPVSLGERVWRWGRRNPTTAALLVTGFVLLGLAGAAGVWLAQDRAERRAEVIRHDAELRSYVGTAVTQAESLRNGFHFREARELLEQAQQRLEPAGPEDMRRQVEQALAELDLAARLDAIHLKRTAIVEGRFDNRGLADGEYEVAFREAGLGQGDEAPTVVAERVKTSNVRMAIVAALDDWALCSADTGKQAWLLEVARRADPDVWRDRVRDPAVWRDRLELAELARVAPLAEEPVQLLVVLGERLQATGGDPTEFLTRVQQENPASFHANFALAHALRKQKPADAIGYCRAAVVARPEAAAAHYNLGAALRATGQHAEAILCFRRTLALDPGSAWAHVFLGASLQDTGRPDEAISSYQQAIHLDPKLPWAYFGLGTALRSRGRSDEAIASFQQGLQLDPKLPWVHYALGETFADKGLGDAAIASYQKALELEPHMAWAHYRLGRQLKLKGKLEEAEAHFQEAVELEPTNVDFLKAVHSISDGNKGK